MNECPLLAMSKSLEVHAGLNGQFTSLVPYLANPIPTLLPAGPGLIPMCLSRPSASLSRLPLLAQLLQVPFPIEEGSPYKLSLWDCTWFVGGERELSPSRQQLRGASVQNELSTRTK